MTEQERQEWFSYLNGVAAGMKETNYDVVEALQDIRQKVLEVPTHIKDIGYYKQRELHSYKGDILEIIDSKIREYTE